MKMIEKLKKLLDNESAGARICASLETKLKPLFNKLIR